MDGFVSQFLMYDGAMTSLQKLEANRANALRSTGPRTHLGKLKAAENSLRHGFLSKAPVIDGLESLEDWEHHRSQMIALLDPSTYLETILAERAALTLWRLRRIAEYEHDAIVHTRKMIDADVAENVGMTKETIEWKCKICASREPLYEFYEALEEKRLKDLPIETARAVPTLVAECLGIRHEAKVQDNSEVTQTHSAGELAWVEICLMAETYKCEPIKLLNSALRKANENLLATGDCLRKSKNTTAHLLVDRMLPQEVYDRIMRYETHLERSLQRTLRELERLKAARSGLPLLPIPMM